MTRWLFLTRLRVLALAATVAGGLVGVVGFVVVDASHRQDRVVAELRHENRALHADARAVRLALVEANERLAAAGGQPVAVPATTTTVARRAAVRRSTPSTTVRSSSPTTSSTPQPPATTSTTHAPSPTTSTTTTQQPCTTLPALGRCL